ncbi:hypothetical protein [Devosia enhydra]|uniref:hypothetical protein n=1 Tax=Devosia enhydra TaxID=665118 RepID=UPI001160B7F5|nr:hypothetical protein [Devosia enhydra]
MAPSATSFSAVIWCGFLQVDLGCAPAPAAISYLTSDTDVLRDQIQRNSSGRRWDDTVGYDSITLLPGRQPDVPRWRKIILGARVLMLGADEKARHWAGLI